MCVDRSGGAVGELDLAQGGDGVKVAGGPDLNLDGSGYHGRPRPLGRKHAASAEASVVERCPERVEVNMVDREPYGTVLKHDGRQFGEQSDDDGRRVDEVGIDSQSMPWNESHR